MAVTTKKQVTGSGNVSMTISPQVQSQLQKAQKLLPQQAAYPVQAQAQPTAQAAKPAQTAAPKQPAYNGLQGLSSGTAQKMGQLQQGYQQGDAVAQAQNALQSVLNQKPQGYESKYFGALDNILQQIQNPQQFKYSFDGDELFKNLADVYTQKGKQASLDAQGQAAALTGGYGNSYGQMVGQQGYQQYLMDLYGRGMDLYDRAYQRYQDGQNNLYNQYNTLAGADATDYGRYRDLVGDWQGERDYYTGRYDTEADRDYGRYMDDLNYATQLAQMENSDYWTGMNYNENVRQFNESLDWQKMDAKQQQAAQYVTAILANGKMPTTALLEQAGLSKKDAKKLMAQIESSGGGGGGGGSRQTGAEPQTGLTAEDYENYYQNIFLPAYIAGQQKLSGVQTVDTAAPDDKNKKTNKTR